MLTPMPLLFAPEQRKPGIGDTVTGIGWQTGNYHTGVILDFDSVPPHTTVRNTTDDIVYLRTDSLRLVP